MTHSTTFLPSPAPAAAFNATSAMVDPATMKKEQNNHAVLIIPGYRSQFYKGYPAASALLDECITQVHNEFVIPNHCDVKCVLIQYWKRCNATVFTWHTDQDADLTKNATQCAGAWDLHPYGPERGKPAVPTFTAVCNLSTHQSSIEIAGAAKNVWFTLPVYLSLSLTLTRIVTGSVRTQAGFGHHPSKRRLPQIWSAGDNARRVVEDHLLPCLAMGPGSGSARQPLFSSQK